MAPSPLLNEPDGRDHQPLGSGEPVDAILNDLRIKNAITAVQLGCLDARADLGVAIIEAILRKQR